MEPVGFPCPFVTKESAAWHRCTKALPSPNADLICAHICLAWC